MGSYHSLSQWVLIRRTMRTSVAVLATFIAFSVSNTAALKPFVDIVKVISNEAENDSQLSHKLKAVKSRKDAVIDAPIELSCTVGEHVEIEQCSWRQHGGPHLYQCGTWGHGPAGCST